MKSEVKVGRKRIYSEEIASLSSLFEGLSNPDVKPLSINKMNKLAERGIFSIRDRA